MRTPLEEKKAVLTVEPGEDDTTRYVNVADGIAPDARTGFYGHLDLDELVELWERCHVTVLHHHDRTPWTPPTGAPA